LFGKDEKDKTKFELTVLCSMKAFEHKKCKEAEQKEEGEK
jgi:hypothetical protein